MEANDASRIIAVVDRRIRKHTKTEATTETTWGEVCGLSADGKHASAYLYGDTETPSQDFRVPSDLALNVGDKVKVAWNARGERWVYDVIVGSAYKKVALNPSTGEILTGDGTVPPTPLDFSGSYDPIGSADAAVDGHEGEADPHPQYAEDAHNHDSNYSALTHNHDTRYARVTEGTTFPASPTNMQRHYHTGHQMLFYWDSSISRWLSAQRFYSQLETSGGTPPFTAAHTYWAPTVFSLWSEVRVTALLYSVFISGTNNSSNYWNITLYKTDAATGPVALYAKNTQVLATGQWIRGSDFNPHLVTNAYDIWQLTLTTVGSPGSIYTFGQIEWRVSLTS